MQGQQRGVIGSKNGKVMKKGKVSIILIFLFFVSACHSTSVQSTSLPGPDEISTSSPAVPEATTEIDEGMKMGVPDSQTVEPFSVIPTRKNERHIQWISLPVPDLRGKLSVLVSIMPAPDGSIWVGTDSSGAYHYDGQTWTNYTEKDGLADNTVTHMAISRHGEIWFATPEGLSRFDGKSWFTYTTRNGLISSVVRSVAVSPDGSVWVGTEKSVSHLVRGSWVHYGHRDGLPSDDLFPNFAVEASGAIWVGSWKALLRFDGRDWVRYNVDMPSAGESHYIHVALDNHEELWTVQYSSDVVRYVGDKSFRYTWKDGLPNENIISLAVTTDGKVWIGTDSGLAYFESGRWNIVDIPPLRRSNSKLEMAAAPDGTLWIVTFGQIFHLLPASIY